MFIIKDIFKNIFRKKPCTPLNGNTLCECKSVFDIKTTATGGVGNVQVTGTLKFKGEICPKCSDSGSDFSLVFLDQNLSDGNQSFEFIPTTIGEQQCQTSVNTFSQETAASGVLVFPNGTRESTLLLIGMNESLGEGQPDVLSLTFIAFTDLITGNIRVSLSAEIPDNQLFIRECQ